MVGLALFAVNANHTSTALVGAPQNAPIPAVWVAFHMVAAVLVHVAPAVINWGFVHGSYQGACAKDKKGNRVSIVKKNRINDRVLKSSAFFLGVDSGFFM